MDKIITLDEDLEEIKKLLMPIVKKNLNID